VADQGASQRRGTESEISTIGQANTLSPNDAGGQNYYTPVVGQVYLAIDSPAVTLRVREDSISPIGVNSDVTADHGTSYMNPSLTRDAHDSNAIATRVKEDLYTPLGVQTSETSNHGTSYVSPILVQTPMGSAGGIILTTYYKLRALDSGGLPPIHYVYWVSTSATLASYTGSPPFGGPLIDLVILATWSS